MNVQIDLYMNTYDKYVKLLILGDRMKGASYVLFLFFYILNLSQDNFSNASVIWIIFCTIPSRDLCYLMPVGGMFFPPTDYKTETQGTE